MTKQNVTSRIALPGRNDPCWCGSGRKYKVCHAQIDERVEQMRALGHEVPRRDMLKTPEQIEKIKKSCAVNMAVLDEVAAHIREGMTTAEIDRIVRETTHKLGGIPAPLDYEGYPYSVCTSVNDQVCHGFPSEKVVLESGDIVNVDCSTIVDGYFSDSSRMFCIGEVSAEKKRLVSGVAAQYESEVIYNSIRDDLKKQGVIFVDTDTAVREYPDLVRKYFGKVVSPEDNKFGALNTAAWSGGSFVYVPKGVHVDIPLQAYFRINTPNMGQFERTLIIADEGSYVHYVEGCTAPIYSTDSLHAAIVEIVVEKHARVRYTTVQNWSNNVYNLVTQRAYVREGGTMEWVDGNIGSKATMKYPACILAEPYAKASTMSLGFAGKGQYQDTGAKMIHLAPHTSSTIVAKSISRGGGRSAYRGLVKIVDGAEGSSSSVVCDALLVDDFSRSDTYPHVDVREDDVSMAHEATVSKVSEDQLFYLMSRGLEEKEAMGMIVRGFVEPISRELPMEYALELNRLVELQMEGSVG